ncbi:MAG: aminotransferase class V-fold PLP-dependent enzyme [Myxococcota bacterium]
MDTRIYLDHATLSPLRPEAAQAIRDAATLGGNPSSLHAIGRAARQSIDDAAQIVRQLVRAGDASVVFTGSGGEANELGVLGLARAQRTSHGRRRILIGPDESGEVMAATAQLARESFAIEALAEARLGDDVALIVLALDQASSGRLNASAHVAVTAERLGIPLHCDATRAAATMSVDFLASGASTLSLASETIGGPEGAGALVTLKGLALTPLWDGGGQEGGLRSGSQAVALIAGFAAAAAATSSATVRPIDAKALDMLWAALDVPVLGGPRRPGVSCAVLEPARADLLIRLAAERGVTLGRVPRGVRASAGWSTTTEELAQATIALASCAPDLQKAA